MMQAAVPLSTLRSLIPSPAGQLTMKPEARLSARNQWALMQGTPPPRQSRPDADEQYEYLGMAP